MKSAGFLFFKGDKMKNTININSIKDSKTRREFIKDIALGFGYVALGSYTLSFLNSCSSDSNPAYPDNSGDKGSGTSKITIDISKPENQALQTVGGTIAISGNALDGNGMLIIRTGQSSVVALSRTCTHQGCTVPNFQNGVSTCPCHGSQFNTSGNPVKGPATQPLKKFNAVLSGNIITITL